MISYKQYDMVTCLQHTLIPSICLDCPTNKERLFLAFKKCFWVGNSLNEQSASNTEEIAQDLWSGVVHEENKLQRDRGCSDSIPLAIPAVFLCFK